MKFEKFGKEKEQVTISTEPFSFAEGNILKHFSNAFDYIKENKPEILQNYVVELRNGMLAKQKFAHFKKGNKRLVELLQKYEHLSEHYDLMQIILNFFLDTLGVTEEQFWKNEEQVFPDWNFFHSIRDIHLVSVKVMIEILGKEEGSKAYKAIADNYVFNYNQNQKNIYEDLDEMRKNHTKFIENNSLGRVRLISDVENGRYIEICLTCDKVRNFNNLSQEDFKLLDTTGCYVHHGLTKLWNEHFILTLDQTLAKGDSYCSYVYHDTRIVDKIEHPPKDFIDKVVSKYELKE